MTRATAINVCLSLAAAGVLLSAVIHLDLYVQSFHKIPIVGPLFLLNAIGGIVLGAVVVAWRHWLPALAAAGFGLVTVVFFWISATVGLFGFTDEPGEPLAILAEISEYLSLILGLIAAVALFRAGRQVVRDRRTGGAARREHAAV